MNKHTYPVLVLFLSLLFTEFVMANDLERLLNLRGDWKFSIGDDKHWAEPKYDDTDWESIYVPTSWENEGFYGYDGYAWYRKKFDGAITKGHENIFIMLGYIDDADEVYINGKLIGFSGGFPPHYATAHKAKRQYYIPPEILNPEGENLIAVRIYDEGGEGGIIHGKVGIYTMVSDFQPAIDLQGVWKFKTGKDDRWKNKYWNDEQWEDIITPSLWRNIGMWELDGYAWYRKTFFLDEKWENEELYVVLGRIDDFDKTFVNGAFVGETWDGRSYGISRSYLKLRVYPLPKDKLLFNGYNTIAVKVYDMGDKGGIYEGPVGIITRKQLQEVGLY